MYSKDKELISFNPRMIVVYHLFICSVNHIVIVYNCYNFTNDEPNKTKIS